MALVERWALGTVWALTPKRIGGVPGLAKLCFEEALAPDYALPDPERALASPPGLAGIVHDFTLPTLFAAYRRGLYPWAHIGPLKWWSPPQRSVLLFKDFICPTICGGRCGRTATPSLSTAISRA